MSEELRSEFLRLFRYEPETGLMFWRDRPRRTSIPAGSEAGSVNQYGYRQVKVWGKFYLTHRVIFLMQKGSLPEQVDHIDHNRLNNKIENLRAATNQDNQRNQSIGKKNTSGVIGVSWSKSNQRWVAQINGKYLGSFVHKAKAIAVRRKAAVYHGYHENHGATPTPITDTQDQG